MKNKKKMNLSIDCQEISGFVASVYSEIGKDGLRFLKYDLHVGPSGLTTVSGDAINIMLPTNKQNLISLDRQLGRGAACTVKQGIYEPLNIRVAIKTINIYDRDKRHQVMNDIRILLNNMIKQQQNGMKNHFIVTLYGAYFDQGSVKVILELMDAGSLANIIDVYKAAKIIPMIDEKILAKIAIQILCGLSQLHSNCHLHRDIKPGNILLNSKGEVKITDFGISRQFVNNIEFSKTFVGTRSYMSPQRIQGSHYSYKSDVWSFGLSMFELATGQFPYHKKSVVEIRQDLLQNGPPQIPSRYSSQFADFIGKSLAIDQNQRASALQLLSHNWILSNISSKTSIKAWLMSIKNEIIPLIGRTQ